MSSSASPFRFRLAHLSDPHIGPLPAPRLMELVGKRFTGYVNWHRGRRLIHDMEMLDQLFADIRASKPDHIALTGDLVNLGLPGEFPPAERFVRRLGSPAEISIVPGNHDAYVRGSMSAMRAAFADYMRGDDVGEVTFPYMRIRDHVALIGVSSAIPTGPFLASGAVGPRQTKEVAAMLEASGQAGFVRVVMIHHSPLRSARFGRGLRDHIAFTRMLSEKGAELVLHGHDHRQAVRFLERREGPAIPVIGVASASAVPGTQSHRAAWHNFTITLDQSGLVIEMATRGTVDGTEAFVETSRRDVLRIAAQA